MKEKGFTLIELVVVLAILGILASVIAARSGGVTGRAGDAAVEATAASVRAAYAMHMAETGGAPSCDELFGRLGLTGSGTTRSYSSASGATTTVVCQETAGVATQASVYNSRSTTYTQASPLQVQF